MSERGSTLSLGNTAYKARQDDATKYQEPHENRRKLRGGLDSDRQLDTQTLGDLKQW